MTNESFVYKRKCVDEIIPREFDFEFPDDLDTHWIPGNPVRSHLFNGISMTMPYLEPFMMRTMMASKAEITNPALLADVNDFVAQEGHHYKCHRRLNDLIKRNGHAHLVKLEERLARDYKKLGKRSLRARLAYSAGFEAMSNGFTTWLIRKRWSLFKNASPHVTSFWLMHMIEETEHKTVAHDAYMATSGDYFPRMLGVFHGSYHVLAAGLSSMISCLKAEKVLHKPKTIVGIIRELSSFVYHVGPFLLRATLPGYDPRNEVDPGWMREWIEGYAKHPEDAKLPLVDTNDPKMPMPFALPA